MFLRPDIYRDVVKKILDVYETREILTKHKISFEKIKAPALPDEAIENASGYYRQLKCILQIEPLYIFR